jgi:hypothetical protein
MLNYNNTNTSILRVFKVLLKFGFLHSLASFINRIIPSLLSPSEITVQLAPPVKVVVVLRST